MKYLVDADVLSEPTKPHPSDSVLAWLRKHEPALVLSAVTLGELRYGILSLPSGKKRTRLLKWFETGIERFPSLDFDPAVAAVWAELLAKLKRNGKAMPIKDSLIAATALRHGLSVCTRNASDFQHAGVKLVNPFDS